MLAEYYIVSVFVILQLIISDYPFGISANHNSNAPEEYSMHYEEDIQHIYMQINDPELNPDALSYALAGFRYLRHKNILTNDSIITIIDYSKSSVSERFFVIDIKRKKILFRSLVAHGKNSGFEYATSFSNIICSKKSSLGFFLTGGTYYGKHGFSLRLNGLENNINNNALERAIVIHAADYVNKTYIKNYGRLGRSFGCPALPINNYENIIGTIRNNSCLYIYYPDRNYITESEIINFTDFD